VVGVRMCLLGSMLLFSAPAAGQTTAPDYRVVVVSATADIATWLRPAASGRRWESGNCDHKKDQSVSIIDAAKMAEVDRPDVQESGARCCLFTGWSPGLHQL
jgi:hypothetical protein